MASIDRYIRFRLPAIFLLAALAVGCSASFGFESDTFDESASPEVESPDWPQADFADASDRGTAFRAGESFLFRGQWGIFRKAGTVEITTEEAPQEGTPALLVHVSTASAGLIRKFYPMNLEATTWLDAQNWRVLRDEVDGKIRSEVSRTVALFDYEENKLEYINHVEPEKSRTKELPYDMTLDYASSILQLRSWDMAVGERYQMCVNSRGKLYFVELQVMEKEMLKTEFGSRECYRIEPVRVTPTSKTFREGGKMSIWVTADAERIPVRLDVKTSVGTARMLLEDYKLAPPEAIARQ